MNATGRDGCASLHCAANEDNPEIISLLLAKGAFLEARNAWGNTPLQMAVQRGTLGNAEAFLKHGADLQTASDEGWTPLHYATKCGHEEVRQMLLAADASSETVDKIALAFQRQTLVGKKVTDPGVPVSRPALGILPRELAPGDLPAEHLAQLMLVEKAGTYVLFLETVQEGSAADRGGLRSGDILLQFDHRKLLESGDLQRMLLDTPAGKRVPVRVYRQGQALNLTIPLD